jgi:NTP pyrophosphatase (non-canonical NTP hydrolase)
MSTSGTHSTDDHRVDAFIWEVVDVAFRRLDQVNGSAPAEITLRVLKIAEEFGEAVQAWIGVTGQNPRKGITHTRRQVADELGDVAITALVAACSMGFDPRQVLAGTAAKVATRFGVPGCLPGSVNTPDAQGDEADGGDRVDAFIWAWVSADFRQLDGTSGSEAEEITLRLLKIAEEFGEAAQAWIGVTGQNPRKAITHTPEEVAAELGDVAFGALVTAASMGFAPRQVLADTAAKVGARYGVPGPPGTEPDPPAAHRQPEPDGTAAPPDGIAVAGDMFTSLVEIADAQTRRFPAHNGPFARVARLAAETGALARQVNHAEGTGGNDAEDVPFDPADLAAEIADVLQAAAGLAVHYDLTGLVRAAVAARHARYHDRGLLPTPLAPAGSAPAPSRPSAG